MKPLSSMPNYSGLEQALSSTTRLLHPSEAHGYITGVICDKPLRKSLNWQALITGDPDPLPNNHLLVALYTATAKQFAEFLFDFQLILPPDHEELSLRAEALTLWTQGFLTGLGLSEVEVHQLPPTEMKEAIKDLIEISKMKYEQVVSSEEDETAYIELVEFIRIAVILIYQDMHDIEEELDSAHHIRH